MLALEPMVVIEAARVDEGYVALFVAGDDLLRAGAHSSANSVRRARTWLSGTISSDLIAMAIP